MTGCFDFSNLTECRGTSAYICDDFETGVIREPWSVYENGSTGSIESTRAHDSVRAVHAVASVAESNAWGLRWEEFDQYPPHAFIRAFVFAPTAPTGNVTLFNMTEDVAPLEGLRIWFDASGGIRARNGVGGADATTGPYPYGRWTCIEWEVESSTSGAMNLWIDDELAAETMGDTLPATRLGKITVGAITQSPLVVPFEVWIDDLIVDDERITCAQ